ncbi:MAG: energy transducer TonB, partial [Bacteroidota bacterium]
DEDYDKTFTKVEIESSYPGGMPAWQRYLNKNLRFPDEAMNNEIQGSVMVQFIVDKEGNVSDVQAIGGPDQGGLRDEAVRVIKKSGKWTPAIQNGRQVKSYKRQPITFQLQGQ